MKGTVVLDDETTLRSVSLIDNCLDDQMNNLVIRAE